MKQPTKRSASVTQVLATNLTNALKVAGPESERGMPTRYPLAALQQATGLARSTIRKLRKGDSAKDSNPDLRTLCRLADELCIPVAFLLMGRQEWKTLAAAFKASQQADSQAAADQQESRHGLGKPQAGLGVLRALDVYPLPMPAITGDQDADQVALRTRQNAAFRKATLVTASLMQAAESDAGSLKQLTLLAACHANADKTHYLSQL